MSERFLKFIPSDEAFWLMKEKPNAFRLLAYIANTARRTPGNPDGLSAGQCHLQHWSHYNLTEREYRTAKEILVSRKQIKIIETNRTRQKSTTGTTTKSTLVELCSSTIWDINFEMIDDRNDVRPPTDRRQTRRIKKEKESHPSIPSGRDDTMIDDDLSFEIVPGVSLTKEDLDSCIKLKGDIEKVKHAIEFIMSSKKRKHPISDWPNALSKWKIENKAQNRIQEHIAYAEKLCKEFPEFKLGRGWICSMHNDRKKDQKGILFESESPYQEPLFVALTETEFKMKCEDFIKTKNMRKKQL